MKRSRLQLQNKKFQFTVLLNEQFLSPRLTVIWQTLIHMTSIIFRFVLTACTRSMTCILACNFVTPGPGPSGGSLWSRLQTQSWTFFNVVFKSNGSSPSQHRSKVACALHYLYSWNQPIRQRHIWLWCYVSLLVSLHCEGCTTKGVLGKSGCFPHFSNTLFCTL